MSQTVDANARTVAGMVRRRALFGEHRRHGVRLSPSGDNLAWLGYDRGAHAIFVAPVSDPGAARVVSPFRQGTIVYMGWSTFGSHLLVERDPTGEERCLVYSINVRTKRVVALADDPDADARIAMRSRWRPYRLVIADNRRDPKRDDLFFVDLRTGKRKELYRNERFDQIVIDRTQALRLAIDDDGKAWDISGKEDKPFRSLWGSDQVVGFDAYDEHAYAFTTLGGLVAINMKEDERTSLYLDSKHDVEGLWLHEGNLQGVSIGGAEREHVFFDLRLEREVTRLQRVDQGKIHVTGRSDDDCTWCVAFDSPQLPHRYHLYDTQKSTARPLFTSHPWLQGLPLAPMHTITLRADEGFRLSGYLTLPRKVKGTKPDEPLPMVLLVHGGPYSRDRWGLNVEHQWLASRGYAALSVNFRGSTGFGAEFQLRGRREWGKAMQRDLDASMDWAVRHGIADPDRVAIMGASYGGYAALTGLTMSPRRYACGVAFAAPTNLVGMVIGGRTARQRRGGRFWVGEAYRPEGRRDLLDHSPTSWVENVTRPVFIAHGANDTRVPRAESDRIVRSLKRLGKELVYALFFGEGHWFSRPANEVAYHALAEHFLARHLGGRAESFEDDLAGAEVAVLAGIDRIPGLRAALPAVKLR